MRDDETDNRLALTEALRAAVPLHIADMWDWKPERRLRAGLPHGWTADVHLADAMMFKSKIKGRAQRAFDVWARGLAVLAFQPGGVNAFGLHFCTAAHPGCPDAPMGDLVSTIQRVLRDPVAMAEFHAILDEYEALIMSEEEDAA